MDLMKKMTLDEKIGQLNLSGARRHYHRPDSQFGYREKIKEGKVGDYSESQIC